MFGHLKAEDFVNLIEGEALSDKRRAHLDRCERCRATWRSVQAVQAEVTSMDADIPEPDWSQFRSSVRDRLLSRSIQRDAAVRRWTGWAIRPAMAWALSVFFAVGITTVTILWNTGHRAPSQPASVESPAPDPSAEAIDAVPDRHLFDDVVSLGDEEQEQLRQMLESAQKGSLYRQ
jgi:hypothetical protein